MRKLILDDLVCFRKSVVSFGCIRDGDFIGWEFSDGRVLTLHPYVEIYASKEEVPQTWQNSLRIQTMYQDFGELDCVFVKSFVSVKKWWQFWRKF